MSINVYLTATEKGKGFGLVTQTCSDEGGRGTRMLNFNELTQLHLHKQAVFPNHSGDAC